MVIENVDFYHLLAPVHDDSLGYILKGKLKVLNNKLTENQHNS